jgi:peptidoglycan/LPS O-acetylase OafA/YrhL
MADWAKIALKVGLIAGVMVAIWGVFALVQIPTISFTGVFAGVGTAMAFINYWIPVFPVIWATTLAMGGLLLALWTARFGLIAVRWLFKVNE